MYLSINDVKAHSPCIGGMKTFLRASKGRDANEKLRMVDMLDKCGFEHTMWGIQAVKGFEFEKLLFLALIIDDYKASNYSEDVSRGMAVLTDIVEGNDALDSLTSDERAVTAMISLASAILALGEDDKNLRERHENILRDVLQNEK